ncbi:MAG TPA: citrate lyase subunit alpha, partial [Bacillota bacterium]|nr:citrate lyase subunit alpha [Bacillota bacterium]
DFNVNVHTDSNGVIMGGSGGHSDTAAGAKLSIIVAPIMRARMPLIVDRVGTISTPGEDIDLLVTQYGLACNPRRSELASRLECAGLPIVSIHDLKAKAESITGVPTRSTHMGRAVARVISRDGMLLDTIAMIED